MLGYSVMMYRSVCTSSINTTRLHGSENVLFIKIFSELHYTIKPEPLLLHPHFLYFLLLPSWYLLKHTYIYILCLFTITPRVFFINAFYTRFPEGPDARTFNKYVHFFVRVRFCLSVRRRRLWSTCYHRNDNVSEQWNPTIARYSLISISRESLRW